MAGLKTVPTTVDPNDFLSAITPVEKQQDCRNIMQLMAEVTECPPVVWGDSIIAFGKYHYSSSRSAQKGDWFYCGFSPRAKAISVYLMGGYKNFPHLMEQLGKHKTSGSCIHISRLSDINAGVFRQLVSDTLRLIREQYPQ